MAERHVFADEAGCFTFSRAANISRYFIICTITTSERDTIARAVESLRRELLWEGVGVSDFFHATADQQAVRDRMFARILETPFKVQATICEKSKAQPQVRSSKSRFYKLPLYFHFKHGIAPRIPADTELIFTAASIGSKKERLTFCNGLDDVLKQTVATRWIVDFRPSSCDPCLQVVDYCAWAIQRKWERNDLRSYNLIKDRVVYEYDLWARGMRHYY